MSHTHGMSLSEQVVDHAPRLLLVFRKLEEINLAVNQHEVQHTLLEEAKDLVGAIRRDHISAAESFVRNPELRAALCAEIEDEVHELIEYVVAAKRFKLEADSRSKDRIVSVGEKLSCRFMTTMLKDRVCVENTWLFYGSL